MIIQLYNTIQNRKKYVKPLIAVIKEKAIQNIILI